IAARGQVFIIWAERQGEGPNTLEGKNVPPGVRSPDLEQSIAAYTASQCEKLAVVAEHDSSVAPPTVKSADRAIGAAQSGDLEIPELHVCILARRGEALTVRTEGRVDDPCGMAAQGPNLLAGPSVPDLNLSVGLGIKIPRRRN